MSSTRVNGFVFKNRELGTEFYDENLKSIKLYLHNSVADPNMMIPHVLIETAELQGMEETIQMLKTGVNNALDLWQETKPREVYKKLNAMKKYLELQAKESNDG